MTAEALPAPLRAEIDAYLRDIYPLWQSVPLMDTRHVVEMTGLGQFSMGTEMVRSHRSVQAFRTLCEGRPSVSRLEQALTIHMPELLGYIISAHPRKIDGLKDWTWTWCRYLDKYNAPTLDAGVADLLENLDALLAGKSFFTTTTVLSGVDVPGEDIVLSDLKSAQGEVTIHSLTPAEFKEMFSSDIHASHRSVMDLFSYTSILIQKRPFNVRFQCEPPEGERIQSHVLDEEARHLAEHVMRCLHIAKSGRMHIASFTHSVHPAVAPSSVSGTSSPFTTSPSGAPALTEQDVETLRRVYPLMLDCRSELVVAANRLVDAERRIHPSDTVVDAAIGLETLLLKASSELTFRVQLNYAFLADEAQRAARVALIKELYAVRNKIVHGRVRSHHKPIDGLYNASRSGTHALRDTILRFLEDEDLRKTVKLDDDYWMTRIVGRVAKSVA